MIHRRSPFSWYFMSVFCMIVARSFCICFLFAKPKKMGKMMTIHICELYFGRVFVRPIFQVGPLSIGVVASLARTLVVDRLDGRLHWVP